MSINVLNKIHEILVSPVQNAGNYLSLLGNSSIQTGILGNFHDTADTERIVDT